MTDARKALAAKMAFQLKYYSDARLTQTEAEFVIAVLRSPLPGTRDKGARDREAFRKALDKAYASDIVVALDAWIGEAFKRGFASSWHYGELWTRIKPAIVAALPPAPMPERGETDEVIARRLATVMHGDDIEWRGFVTKAHHWMSLSMDAAAASNTAMPEREGMRDALIEQCAKRAESYFENYELANPVARGNVKAIGKKIADDIRAALAPHDKTEG